MTRKQFNIGLEVWEASGSDFIRNFIMERKRLMIPAFQVQPITRSMTSCTLSNSESYKIFSEWQMISTNFMKIIPKCVMFKLLSIKSSTCAAQQQIINAISVNSWQMDRKTYSNLFTLERLFQKYSERLKLIIVKKCMKPCMSLVVKLQRAWLAY
jgi:hypothetical protein